MSDIPLPCTLPDVEQLVQRFYLPGSPQIIADIGNTLSQLQRSQDGWQIADTLLQSQDRQVRFFGALTFTIKIHNDWKSLNEDAATALLERLLLRTVQLINAGETALVVRKLCNTLVAYFLRPNISWSRCIKHLICCFNAGTAIPSEGVAQLSTNAKGISNLSQSQLLAVLWFASCLVDEVGKLDNNSVQTYSYHNRVAANLQDVVLVLRHCINFEEIRNSKVVEEATKTFHSWVSYAHRAWIEKSMELEPLQELTGHTLQNLGAEDLFCVTEEFLSDVLMTFPAFFTSHDLSALVHILSSPETQNLILAAMRDGCTDGVVGYPRLLLAFSDATVHDLAKDTENPRVRQILYQLTQMLVCENSSVTVNDSVSLQTLGFWATYTEFLVDSQSTELENIAWLTPAKTHVGNIIKVCWEKIKPAPPELAITWDSEMRANFKAFRSDVYDLIQSSYALLGLEIFERFSQLIQVSLRNRAWPQLEATLFCLNALSDPVADGPVADGILADIFGSSLFVDVTKAEEEIPVQTRQTAVSVVDYYIEFFERHAQYLAPALNFLFASLESPALAGVAAKSIYTLCSSCRKQLVPELDTFLQQYDLLFSWQSTEANTKEKVIGAVAALIQARCPEQSKIDPLCRLLEYPRRDTQKCIDLMSVSRIEDAQISGLCALRSLVNIGKALQSPDDVVIDLDTDRPQTLIWQQKTGVDLQVKIVEMVQTITGLMSWDGAIIEAACQVLRAGYTETLPGPFVFPHVVTENFVIGKDSRQTARMDCVLNTAAAMIMGRSTNSSLTRSDEAAETFLFHLLGQINILEGVPANDPEVSASCIDLAEKLIPRYLAAFTSSRCQKSLPNFFSFALQCLTASEIMPKRAAANFWSSFVWRYDLEAPISSIVSKSTDIYGPMLAQALVWNIGGEAVRSELDILAEPLKKLVVSQPKTKTWLSDALFSENFPSKTLDTKSKRMFLQKIISLRGSRTTNQLVKEFWMTCRGTTLLSETS